MALPVFVDVRWEECLSTGRVRVLSVRPRRPRVPALVHREHLRLFAVLTKPMSSIDRESHRFPLGLVWPVLFTVEFDEPRVTLTNNYVARMWMARNDVRRQRGVMKLGSKHSCFLLVVAGQFLITPPVSIWFPSADPISLARRRNSNCRIHAFTPNRDHFA